MGGLEGGEEVVHGIEVAEEDGVFRIVGGKYGGEGESLAGELEEIGGELRITGGKIDDDEGAADVGEGVIEGFGFVDGAVEYATVFAPVGGEFYDGGAILLEEQIEFAEIVGGYIGDFAGREKEYGRSDYYDKSD